MARSSLACADERQVRDFVEEQRAAVGLLELAAPAADAGRRPFLDPEQLRLEQRFDDRRAVEGERRAVAPVTERMHAARDQFLARAALALDQHDEVLAGGASDAFVQLPHDGRAAQQVALIARHRVQGVSGIGLSLGVAQQRLERLQQGQRRLGGRQRPAAQRGGDAQRFGSSRTRPRPVVRSSGSPVR